VNIKNITKLDLGEVIAAAVVHTTVFSNYMRGGKFFNHLKDYHIFKQGYAHAS
jgi:hypothetical protein